MRSVRLLDDPPDATDHGAQDNAEAYLCGMKTLVDLLFHLGTHRRRQAVPGEGLYGAAAS